MSVGLLIIGHDGVGPALLGTATLVLGGECPLEAKVISATRESEPEEMLEHMKLLIEELDEGDGVLVLTDLLGSTPTNIAQRLLPASGIRIVAGVNLGMLLNVLNYPSLGLADLVGKAVEGGRGGVLEVGAG
jgi:PTS system ascorbate-specific IIA component